MAVAPIPEAAVVSAHLWFDAGAADETPAEHGAAHFVEHLLFKGTERRPVGGSAGAIEGLGGDLNAWTSYDETTLHATALREGTAEVLDVLIDMAQHAVFDEDEVERERQVVLEELRGYADDPESVAADHLQSQVFGRHAYGRPIIGTEASVGALTRDDLVAFWRRHYHPGRAILSVAGPVDPVAIRDQVRASTGDWPVGASRESLDHPGSPPRRVRLLDRDFGSVVVQMGYPGPAVDDPDVAALDVLLAGLGQGGSSRLHTRLDLQAGVASSVWAQAQHYRQGGLVAVTFCCGETEEALALAHETLMAVGERGLDVAEVQRARDGLLADLLFATETTDGVAGELAWSLARLGHAEGLDAYRRALREVTPDDVTRVAQRFLVPDQLQVVVIDREITASTLERQVPPETPAPRPPSSRTLDGPTTIDLDGATIALWPDSTEVVGIKMVGWGGQSLEEARLAGSTEAWARTVVRGAGPYDAVTFAERADALALSFDATAGRSTMGLDATFPAAHSEAALALFGRMVTEPRFDVEDFNHVREAMLDDLAAQVDQSDTVATEALWRTLWPRHPWRLPVLGTPATLSRVRPGRLATIHDGVTRPDNLVIGLAGGFDPDVVLAELERWIDTLAETSTRPVQMAPPPRDRAPTRRASPRTRYAGTQQATVILGTRGVAFDDPDRVNLAVSTAVLDSQAGRLFLQLREVRGLAYSVWARSDAGLGGGTFSAGLATDPNRVDEAADALRESVLELARTGPTVEELDRVRRMIVGQAAMRLQRVAGRAAELAWSERLGRPVGVDALRERLAAVTPETVQQALERLRLHEAVTVRVLPRPNAESRGSA
ncbi:MAG: pitrilysin family protein [Myxococcota bacterium]